MNSRSLGSYSMANYSIWTGSELMDEVRRFGNEISGTNGDITTNRNALISAGSEGTRFWNDWQIFMRDWAAYQAMIAREGPPTLGTTSPTNLRGLVDRYNTLEQRFRSMTGIAGTARSGDTRSAGLLSVFRDSPLGTGGTLALFAAGGLGVIALVSLAVLATQARAITAPLRRNRRRRR